MTWIILLVFMTYLQSLCNKFISDDITINCAVKKDKYPLFTKKALDVFTHFFDCLEWRLFKEKHYLHHIVSMVLFMALSCTFYKVTQKFLPGHIAFIAALIFVVHPVNNQIAAWISAKWWSVSATIALWGLYFNDSLLYIFSAFFASATVPFILLYKMPLVEKVLGIIVMLFVLRRQLNDKVYLSDYEGEFKGENFKVYPRKIIVAIKSFCYYFTIAVFPVRMGWFHDVGEPIDDDLKSANFHFFLCLCLIGIMLLFVKTPAFIGLMLFALGIAPFSNFVTFALFTSERYMAPAIMGWSIFLAYIVSPYPLVATAVIAVYFMRTQLQLWSFKDDFHLAISSLINFSKSGYAWTNLANMLLAQGKPSATFDLLRETEKRCPKFPTTYWLYYVMYRSVDILNDFDNALINLEKAVHYGRHDAWRKELDEFKRILRKDRVEKFKKKYVAEYPVFEQLRRTAQFPAPENRETLAGTVA